VPIFVVHLFITIITSALKIRNIVARSKKVLKQAGVVYGIKLQKIRACQNKKEMHSRDTTDFL